MKPWKGIYTKKQRRLLMQIGQRNRRKALKKRLNAHS